MVNFLLKKCTNCDSLQDALCALDGVLAQYGKNAWQNYSFLTSKPTPQLRVRQLLYYKDILNNLQWNQEFYCEYTMPQIVSRVLAITGGNNRIARRMKIPNPITTTTTSTTTTTTTTDAPQVNVDNNAINGSGVITGLTIAGVTPSGLSFPINAGTADAGTTFTVLVPTLSIICSGNAGSITVTDSDMSIQCQNYTGAGTYNFILGSISSTNDVLIVLNDVGDTC